MVEEKRLTNSAADCFLAFKTLADISRRSSGHFCNCWARCAMRSSVEDGTSGGGRRYVASAMSKGKTASTPWAMKNGEKPIDRRTVTRSAQNTRGAILTHLECSLLQVFMRDSQMSKCFRSTTPFAWEL